MLWPLISLDRQSSDCTIGRGLGCRRQVAAAEDFFLHDPPAERPGAEAEASDRCREGNDRTLSVVADRRRPTGSSGDRSDGCGVRWHHPSLQQRRTRKGAVSARDSESNGGAFEQTLLPAVRASRGCPAYAERRRIVIVASIFGREAGGRMTSTPSGGWISLESHSSAAGAEYPRNRLSPGVLFEGGSWWRRQQADPGHWRIGK